MFVFIKNMRVNLFLGYLFLSSFVFPCTANDRWVGKVIYVSGKLIAVTADNSERVMQRGSRLHQGEVLKTADLSTAQLRFRDDTVIVLKSDTEFSVDTFYYNEIDEGDEGNEGNAIQPRYMASRFSSSLLTGSLRAITGAIGKENPDAYWMRTPAATISWVQNANYELVVVGNNLAVAVWDGSITVENQVGRIVLGEGSEFSYTLISEGMVGLQGLSESPDLAMLHTVDQNEEEIKINEVNGEGQSGEEIGEEGNNSSDNIILN